MDDLANLMAQRRREGHSNPPPRSAVPHIAIRYRYVEHLFEAQRLSAELQIGRRPMPDARLVFDRTDHTWFDLDRIGAARQSQGFRPQRKRPEHQPSSFAPVAPAVNPSVRSRTPHCLCVVAPHAIAVDEGALSGTVHEVLYRRNGDNRLIGHSCSAPNALVVSAELLHLNWTLCHAACTPVCDHTALLSGFQTSRRASMPASSRG